MLKSILVVRFKIHALKIVVSLNMSKICFFMDPPFEKELPNEYC